MKGKIKSSRIDILGLKLQLAQGMAYLKKAESIFQTVQDELVYFTSQEDVDDTVK